MRTLAALVVLGACSSSGTPPPDQPGDLAIAITSPAAGDELLATDHPTIAVTGTVTSSSGFGVLRAWVDGVPVTLDDSGAFTADVAPVVGINHIEVDATDGGGVPISQQLDVMWGPDYLPPATGTTGFAIADALDLDLGQQFFDGRRLGSTLDLSTDPIVAHDLASALELILWNVDLASLIGGGLQLGSGSSMLDVTIPSATPAAIVVDAVIADTPEAAIDLSIDLNGVFLAMSGTFQFSGQTMNVQGGITADMHASAHMAMALQADGTVKVTASDVTAVVGPLSPQFTGPDGNTLDGFIAVGNNDFRLLVERLIQEQLIPTFTDRIPPLLEQLLGATGSILDDVSFSLDSTLGTPVTLTLNGTPGSLDVAAGPAIGAAPGHVTVRQGATIATSAVAPVHAGSRGALRIAAVPAMPASGSGALQVALSQDFLNALLHSLWNSGLLDGTAMLGGLAGQISAKLPPVAIPTPDDVACEIDGVRCDLVLQLGQVELTLPDLNQSFALNATAGARIVVDGTTVSIVIDQNPMITVWETSPPQKDEVITAMAVHDIVATVVWPKLFGAIGSNLHITLPIPDLAALGLSQLSPNLADAQLQLAVHPNAAIGAGYLTLGADLELQTPALP